MTNIFAYNIPFASIFLMMVAAIITPVLPNRNWLPEKLSCCVICIVGMLSSYLIYALTNSGQSITFTFPLGKFPAPWGNE